MGIAAILAQCFGEHIVGLEVHYTMAGRPQYLLYTGVLLGIRDCHFWLTAGHVVDELMKLQESPAVENVRPGLVDGYDHAHAATIPVSLRDLHLLKPTAAVDFGFAFLREGYVAPLLANPGMRPVTPLIWRGHESSSPEGYYLVGFPNERTSLVEVSRTSTRMECRGRTQLVCLPLERVVPQGNEEPRGFWSHPGGFYGRLLHRTDSSGEPLSSIEGMSGGPILSIERTLQGQLKYRLFGIQATWLPRSGVLRGEPVSTIAALLEAIFSQHGLGGAT